MVQSQRQLGSRSLHRQDEMVYRSGIVRRSGDGLAPSESASGAACVSRVGVGGV